MTVKLRTHASNPLLRWTRIPITTSNLSTTHDNTNVRSACPGPTRRHVVYFGTTKWYMWVKLRPHTASNTTETFKFKHTHARSNANVLPVCPGPTWHPFHTFSNEQRWTQSHHRYCSVFEQQIMIVRLLHQTSITPIIAISQSNTRIHQHISADLHLHTRVLHMCMGSC